MRYGWSLEAGHWSDFRKAVEGYDWQRTYLEKDYDDLVPIASGIYLICASLKRARVEGKVMGELYNAVYVGQAANLQRRFRQHVRGYGNVVSAKNIFRRLDFWYTLLEESQLRDVEQILLNALGPSANIKNVKARIGGPVPAGRLKGD